MPWTPPLHPFEYAEQALITAILDSTFPPDSALPGERDLAARLGVTRPTLREVLGKLAADGWLTIQHGKPTRVNDYWREGGLNVLSALVRYSRELPADFIPNLLAFRLAMAPAYARAAIEHNATCVSDFLAEAATLDDSPETFAAFDWKLHHTLTTCSRNPIYTLVLNGFAGFYEAMARRYFTRPAARAASQAFYTALLAAAQNADPAAAETVTRRVMAESIELWRTASRE